MMFLLAKFRSIILMLIIFLSACTSHVPPEIKDSIEGAPDIGQVRESADTHLSKTVRWGGLILNTDNKLDSSWVTILAYPLTDNGEPREQEQSLGRFIAIVDKFLEPTVYSKDRKFTITGKLLRTETQKVGDFPYEYPVVQVEHFYLWPPEPEYDPYDYPPPYWWHDPWYNPYYPWHHPY